MISRRRLFLASPALLILFALGGLSCGQYEYSSPLPGIIEVRLAVNNTRTDILSFTSADTTGGFYGSFFVLNLKVLEVFQADGGRLPIYANLAAIRRNPDGDNFNALAALARDSALLLGIGYASPGTYTRLEVRVSPAQTLTKSFGLYTTEVDVIDQPPYQQLQQMPNEGETLSIPVEEGRTTRVVVTFDMDRSLIQRTESFNHLPHYYVSSVHIY